VKKETYSDIWNKLSNVDVSHLTEDKNNLTYLSWAKAWGVLMEYYPEATYMFYDNTIEADGSVTVHCSVTINDACRTMWLPVMNYANKAIPTPSSKDISDNKMRCLVKCLAMFGLGHNIYADMPFSGSSSPSVSEGKASQTEPLSLERSTPTLPCGKNKGKTYKEVFGANLDLINSAIKYYTSHAKDDVIKNKHLSSLKSYRAEVNSKSVSRGVIA
jgi:hypothetical protein